MSAALPIPVIQLLQVLTVALGAPMVTGVIAKVEARLQGRRGPRVLQPYYDLAKLARKESLAPEQASWFFLAAPLIAVAAYLTIPLLIPVLTSYGLPLGYMGDILGGGFLLSLASFVIATAAAETGSPYAQLGSSRAKTFSAITEPVVLFVVFTVALLTGTDLPYALAATVRSGAGQVIRPAHLLASAALFMVILHETGRIGRDAHRANEFGMIEEARSFEHSGPYFALLKWGGQLKQLILFTILADVFLAPWGLASTQRLGAVLLAIVAQDQPRSGAITQLRDQARARNPVDRQLRNMQLGSDNRPPRPAPLPRSCGAWRWPPNQHAQLTVLRSVDQP
ncbi:MAG: NADH-quinone oxidoreductase subunit H [Trebonia sp.]|uniref:respiratory chain complex I subunit 1 family protein n=2 Tax=Trebonia sp. TaxID=2767075 RepID=UPI003C760B73